MDLNLVEVLECSSNSLWLSSAVWGSSSLEISLSLTHLTPTPSPLFTVFISLLAGIWPRKYTGEQIGKLISQVFRLKLTRKKEEATELEYLASVPIKEGAYWKILNRFTDIIFNWKLMDCGIFLSNTLIGPIWTKL